MNSRTRGVKERVWKLPADGKTEKLRKDRDRRTDLPSRRSRSREARRTAKDEKPCFALTAPKNLGAIEPIKRKKDADLIMI